LPFRFGFREEGVDGFSEIDPFLWARKKFHVGVAICALSFWVLELCVGVSVQVVLRHDLSQCHGPIFLHLVQVFVLHLGQTSGQVGGALLESYWYVCRSDCAQSMCSWT
jgi:hypothetical protein